MKITVICDGVEHPAEVIDGVIYAECNVCNGMLISDCEVEVSETPRENN